MNPVIIESPYAVDVVRNKAYLKECVLDCLRRGESPYASHAFFTQFLDDTIREERRLGIEAGLVWSKLAQKVVFYVDHGISTGMLYARDYHTAAGHVMEFRRLYPIADHSTAQRLLDVSA